MPRRLLGALVLVSLGCSLAPRPAAAQEVSAADLKAAFLANFAKFTVWPAEAIADGRSFTFCVIGDRTVASALERTLKAHPSDMPMGVSLLKANGPLSRCHLLYVSGLGTAEAAQLLDSVRDAAVFTVSDSDGFAERGGVAQLTEANGRMRFSINQAAAQRQRLSLNARLLSLATLVKEVNHGGR